MSETSLFVLILYALIGVTGALSIVVFVWGFITYISRLGTERRKEGLAIMEWSVGLVVTSIILIGIFRFFNWWFMV